LSGRHCDVIGGLSLDKLASFEAGADANEGDELGCVDRAPAGLGGFDEFERHREAGGLGAGTLGDLGAMPDRGEGRLDRVGGAQVHPTLGGEVVEREQLVEIVGDFRDGLAELGAVGQLERRDSAAGVLAVFCVPDLGQRTFGLDAPISVAPPARSLLTGPRRVDTPR
jgi:hypothetical protein